MILLICLEIVKFWGKTELRLGTRSRSIKSRDYSSEKGWVQPFGALNIWVDN